MGTYIQSVLRGPAIKTRVARRGATIYATVDLLKGGSARQRGSVSELAEGSDEASRDA